MVDVDGVLGWETCVHRYRFLQIQINDKISQVSLKQILNILAFEGGGHLTGEEENLASTITRHGRLMKWGKQGKIHLHDGTGC